MRTLRFLLLATILTIACALSTAKTVPQGRSMYPTIEMHSTSTMPLSGTHLPLAVETGSQTTYGEQAGPPKNGHIRKVGEGDGFENEDEPEAPYDPYPIGDAAASLALLALAYGLIRFILYRHRSRA